MNKTRASYKALVLFIPRLILLANSSCSSSNCSKGFHCYASNQEETMKFSICRIPPLLLSISPSWKFINSLYICVELKTIKNSLTSKNF